jgi:uncharacterized phage protein (TIGR02218 family)
VVEQIHQIQANQMKTTSAALITYFNSLRPTSDAPLYSADLFTITLLSGTILTYCDVDQPVFWNGSTFLANSLLVSGLRYKSTCGLNVDKQQIVIAARSTDTLGGIPFLQALAQGALDGATIQREKAFFSSWAVGNSGTLAPIGTVILFKGRVAQIDEIGRTTAKITVASDLVLLDLDMPRNLFAPHCQHVLFDTGCGLASGTYSASGTVGAGSTVTTIEWSGATSAYAQGVITFTSGVNAGASATIKSAGSGWLQVAYPLPNTPGVGDAFTAAQGCDHTQATCQSKFANLARFRGFPYVPPPQIVTGPLASYSVARGKGK